MSITGAQLITKIAVEGSSEATNQVRGYGKVVDQTKEQSDKASGGLKGMFTNALSFAAGGAIFAGLGFLKDQISGIFTESMNAEAGLAQTNKVLESTHGVAGITANAVLDLATQYSHLTKFSDDTVQASENMLLTFTNIGKNVFPQATKTVLDMSQALGQDTKNSAIQLGKALNDPVAGITALQRVGVTFSQGQKDQIKNFMDTNNIAGAQKVILKELQKEFGGSAEAAGATFGGQLAIAGQRLDDLKQTIGDAVMPILARFLGWINESAIPALQRFAGWIQTNIIPALQQFGGWIQTNVIPVLQQLGTWIGQHIIPALQQFGGFLMTSVLPALQQFGGFLRGTVWPILQQIGSFLVSTFTPLWQQLVAVWNGQILPALKQLWAALVPLWPVLQQIGVFVGGVLVVAFGILVGVITGVVKAIAGFLTGVATIIGGVVQVITGVVQVISGIVTFVVDLLTGHFNKLGGDLKRIWDGIVNMFTGVWNIIKGIFQAAWGAISGFVSGLVQGIIGFFQHLWNVLVGHSIIPDMIGAIVGWFLSLPGKAMSAIGGLLGRLVGFFGDLAGRAVQWGLNIIGNLAGGIINGIWSSLGNAMSAIGTFIHDHLPSSPAKRGPLRELALQGAKIPEQIGQGMVSGLPKLQSSLNLMLTPMAGITPMTASGGSTGAAPQINVSVYLDGARLANKLMPHIVQQIRVATGVKF